MITSKVGRGLIYAGETPLACDIAVEQTGPMQLTVRAGSFTSTGDRKLGVPSQTYTLDVDCVIDLVSDPHVPVGYDIDLAHDDMTTSVVVKRRTSTGDYAPLTPPWTKVHELLFEFILPAGRTPAPDPRWVQVRQQGSRLHRRPVHEETPGAARWAKRKATRSR